MLSGGKRVESKYKIWTEERNQWLFQHGSESPAELYRLFCEAYPDVKTTQVGVTNQRSRIGACSRKNPNKGSRKARPLYSEQEQKGYIRIKIAQPNVWIQKNKWVWCETHPWLVNTVKENDNFVFLDGNNRNFSPDNIEKVSVREMAILNGEGKLPKGKPEIVTFRIAKARLKLNMLDKAEQYGLCTIIKDKKGKYRRLKTDSAAYTRKYYQAHKDDKEFMDKIRASNKRSRDNMSKEAVENKRKYKHEWYLNNKKKEKNNYDS